MKILSSTISSGGIRGLGLDVYSGMVCCMLWRVSASILETRLGGNDPHMQAGWGCSDEFAVGGALSAYPDVWTDGSLVRDEVSGACCGGSGVFALASGASWLHRT